MAIPGVQHRQDGAEVFGELLVERSGCGGATHVGMLDESQEDLGHLLHGQDVVDQSRGDRAAGHAVVGCRLRVLGQGQAAVGLDGLQAVRALGAGPGEDDADGLLVAVLGQGVEEEINGYPPPAALGRRGQVEHLVADGDVLVRRNDVDMIGLDRHSVLRLHDRHGRVRGEQLDHVALAGGVEVRDEHERQAIVRRHRIQERAERLEAPGGGADAHDDRPGRAAVGRSVRGLRGGPLRDGALRPRRGRSSSCLRSFRGPLRSHRHLSSALEETLLPSIPERHRRGYGQFAAQVG